MIIIDQYGATILNFKVVSNIGISLECGRKYVVKAFQIDEGQDIELGEYTTVNRAKEILNEIAIMYSKFETAKCMTNYLQTQPIDIVKAMPHSETKAKYFDIYEMPKE